MARPKDNIFKTQARVLKALANESRLKIVDRLSRGECSVGELTKLVGSDRSTVSKHLAVLRSHGIVDDRRAGNVVYYTLLTPCVMSFFSCATQVLKERGRHQTIRQLAARTMALWQAPPVAEELRLDVDYQQALPEIKQRALAMTAADLPHCFDRLWE